MVTIQPERRMKPLPIRLGYITRIKQDDVSKPGLEPTTSAPSGPASRRFGWSKLFAGLILKMVEMPGFEPRTRTFTELELVNCRTYPCQDNFFAMLCYHYITSPKLVPSTRIELVIIAYQANVITV